MPNLQVPNNAPREPLDERTPVMLSLRQLIGAVASLIILGGAVVWAVIQVTIGGLTADVSAIRTDLGSVRASADSAPQKLSEAQLALTKDIQGLRVDLTSFRGDFKELEASIDDMKSRVNLLYEEARDAHQTGRVK